MYTEITARLDSRHRLDLLRRTGLLDTPAEEAFDRFTRLAARVLNAPVALVSLVDEDRQFFKSCYGLPEPWAGERQTPLSHSFCQHVVIREEPLIVEDARTHPLVEDNLAIPDLGVVAYAGIPIVAGGQVLGSFCAIDTQPRRWTEEEIRTLRDLAAAVSTEIELRLAARSLVEHTEVVLGRQNQQLREAQQMAQLGSWEWELSTGRIVWSEQLYRIFGLVPGEVITFERFAELLHPDDRETVVSTVARARESGETYALEHRIVRPDGSVRWMYSQGEAVRDETGAPVGLFGTAQDITERKAAQEREHQLAVERVAREQSEAARERVTRIMESITEAFFALDREWRFTYLNSEAEHLLQRSREELLGRNVWEEFPDAVGSTFYQQYQHAVRERTTVQFEEFYPPLDGWFEVRAFPSEEGLSVYFHNINERKRFIDELHRQEERYRSLVEATSAIVWDTPASGEFESEQPQWNAFTGQSFEEYLGWGWLEALHPDDREPTRDGWIRAVESRSLYEMQHRIRRHDGEYRHMQVRAVPIVGADGAIREWVGVHTDVTEQMRMEEAIRESESRFRIMFRDSPLPMWVFDLESKRFLDVNATAQRQYGWSREEFLDMTILDIRPPEHSAELEGMFTPDRRGIVHRGLFHHRRKDGSVIDVEVTTQETTLGDRPARVAVVLDVTERRRAEEERERLIRTLEAERGRLREILAQAPAVVALYHGPEHRITMANPAWERVSGRSGVIGRTFREVFPELEGTGLFELLDQVYETGEPFLGNEMRLSFDRDGDGQPEESYWNFVWQPITGQDGRVEDVMVHAVEVTDQVLARQEVERKAEELARLARALEISNRDLDQFAYVASHDLKAPLRGIANLSQWIEEDLGTQNLSEETREHLGLLRGRVHRMEGLIDGILQYSRAGRVRDAAERVDTGSLVREVLDLLAPPEEVAVEVQAEMPTIVAERLPLQQVLLNLIGNAIKHAHGPGARVEVGVSDAGAHWEFHVRDNGPGIAPEYHDRIFGIFQTLQARDKVEGTGIGLSIVQKTVESRGGRVWVESEEGAGATFRFLWPKESQREG